MEKPRLYEQLLPPGLVIGDIITDALGRPLYNYEDWARELVNASEAFMRKTGGRAFRAPKDESRGQNDAITEEYQIDFKLIPGQSMMKALREMSVQKTVMGGMTLSHSSRSKGSMKGLWLHKALRLRNKEDMRRIWSSDPEHDALDDQELEIAGFCKLLKKKNLLLIYPTLLYTDDAAVTQNTVSEEVYSDYKGALELRREELPNYESFVAYLMEGQMVIVEVVESGWRHFDSVPVSSSKTFMEIAGRYDKVDYAQIEHLYGVSTRKGQVVGVRTLGG